MCTILVLLQLFMNIAKTRLHNKMKYDFFFFGLLILYIKRETAMNFFK